MSEPPKYDIAYLLLRIGEHPLFLLVTGLLACAAGTFVVAWSIYFLGMLPWPNLCMLWPPGWKCP